MSRPFLPAKQCEDCGEKFVPGSYRKRFCARCRKRRDRESERRSHARKRIEQGKPPVAHRVPVEAPMESVMSSEDMRAQMATAREGMRSRLATTVKVYSPEERAAFAAARGVGVSK